MILDKVRNLDEKKRIKARNDAKAEIQAEWERINPDKLKQNYTKKYTMKEWKRFTPAQQEVLSNRYTVILTDHETKSEKAKRYVKKITLENVGKGIDKFNSAQNKFWKDFDKGMGDSLGKNKSSITMFPTKKSKGNNSNLITGGKSKVKIF